MSKYLKGSLFPRSMNADWENGYTEFKEQAVRHYIKSKLKEITKNGY